MTYEHCSSNVTYWCPDKLAAILQMTFSMAIFSETICFSYSNFTDIFPTNPVRSIYLVDCCVPYNIWQVSEPFLLLWKQLILSCPCGWNNFILFYSTAHINSQAIASLCMCVYEGYRTLYWYRNVILIKKNWVTGYADSFDFDNSWCGQWLHVSVTDDVECAISFQI